MILTYLNILFFREIYFNYAISYGTYIGKRLNSKRNAIKTPSTKKGANGISLFIPYFFVKTIRRNPIIAPDQKATTAPESNLDNPSNQPNPKANFASPRPIQVPLETSHKKAKGRASNTPDKNSKTDGIWG